jgi:hypothetical protein
MSTEKQTQDDLEQGVLGFSDGVSEVPESLLAIMKSNSYELDKMMYEFTKQSIC